MKAEKVLGSYTEQILDQNFLELSRFGDDVVKFAESVYSVLEKQQHRIADLEQMVQKTPSVIVKAKGGRFLPFIAGAALGVYVYRNRQNLKQKMSAENVAEKVEKVMYGDPEKTKPGPASKIPDQHGVKINGSNDPRPES